MTGTAIIYARVSSAGQAEAELPIESQIERCEQKAREMGLQVLRVFVDAGRSAWRADARPEFDAAITYCETHSVDYFVTWSTNRFSRNTRSAGKYKDRLQACGCEIAYVSVQINRRTDEGWLTESIMEIMDEMSSRRTSQDTMRSMLVNARGGFWNGGHTPYGFRAVPAPSNAKKKVLEIDPDEGPLVQRVFRMRESGLGARAIADQLNQTGIRRRGAEWCHGAVRNLLHSRACLGETVFNKRDHRTGRKKPQAEWVVAKTHPALISADVFDRVQGIMAEATAKTASVSATTKHLFTGLMRCGHCGGSMQVETAKGRSRRYSYYNCRRWIKTRGCRSRRVRADLLDEWLCAALLEDVLTPENVAREMRRLRDSAGGVVSDLEHEAALIAQQVAEQKRRQARLFEFIEAHGAAASELMPGIAERIARSDADISELEARHVRLCADASAARRNSATAPDAADVAAELVRGLKAAPRNVTRRLFGAVLECVIVAEDAVRVTYRPGVLASADLALAVHSNRSCWLPNASALGTVEARIVLPNEFRRAA